MKKGERVLKERGRSKIREQCKFSLLEVKGDNLEVVRRVRRLGASGQIVSETGSLWEPQVGHMHTHAHTNGHTHVLISRLCQKRTTAPERGTTGLKINTHF